MDPPDLPPPPDHASGPADDAGAPPPAGFLAVLAAVFASFFGVRKKASGERDAASIKLVHVVFAGLLGAAILVALVLTLVRLVVRAG